MKQSTQTWNNWLLLSFSVMLAIAPLLLIKDSEFEGADTQAEEAITEIQSDYQPWFEPIIAPPGAETEGLLFALQAGIGAGAMGYIIGFYKGKSGLK